MQNELMSTAPSSGLMINSGGSEGQVESSGSLLPSLWSARVLVGAAGVKGSGRIVEVAVVVVLRGGCSCAGRSLQVMGAVMREETQSAGQRACN